jgi:beta-lactamase class A
MIRSRRDFLKTAATATTLAAAPLATADSRVPPERLSPNRIIDLFKDLPGDVALKILVPAAAHMREFSAEVNADKMLFFASAIKTFVLCEALRQADSPDIDSVLEAKALALDSSVWSFGSPSFNPPTLTGIVSERTTLEAMITRSDNTATDMMFKLAGADNVRAFIASLGLTHTLVPDSTRVFTGYLFGADDYKNITWDKLVEVVSKGQQAQPFLNPVETLASSAGDLVSYYSRALQGEFFKHEETLDEFRRILTLCDFIYLVPLPRGMSAYAKSGNVDFPGFHARSIAGGMFVAGRWAYFAFVINWTAASDTDPETVEEFFVAINRALSLLKDLLDGRQRGIG